MAAPVSRTQPLQSRRPRPSLRPLLSGPVPRSSASPTTAGPGREPRFAGTAAIWPSRVTTGSSYASSTARSTGLTPPTAGGSSSVTRRASTLTAARHRRVPRRRARGHRRRDAAQDHRRHERLDDSPAWRRLNRLQRHRCGGLVGRESGFKEGRPIRVLPFGYVAHDEAADQAAPLAVAVTVGAEGIVREIAVTWGTSASALTYKVAYSNPGATPAPVAPENARPLEHRTPAQPPDPSSGR